jgi:hypothetical protein
MSVFDSAVEIRRGSQVQWFRRSEVPRRVRPVPARASILIMMAETAEELRKRPEIRKELERVRFTRDSFGLAKLRFDALIDCNGSRRWHRNGVWLSPQRR